MNNATFNRVEKKYILSQDQYDKIKLCFSTYMKKDTYTYKNKFYTISNIYYDTDDNMLIKKSVSKPKFKVKLRLRAYGEINENTLAFLELKKKINGYVNKRRTKITVKDAIELVEKHKLPDFKDYHNFQVIKEIVYFLGQYDLKPSVVISYDREAYFCKANNDLRITFDKNIQTRRFNINLTDGVYGKQLLENGYYVMEIKTNQNMPLWLIEILNNYKIFPTSFSKYGTEFYNYLNELERGNKECLNPYLKPLRLLSH